MERQTIKIRRYDWVVDVFYLPSRSDMPFIMNEMFRNGASPDSLRRISCNLCKRNNGCAYTNPNAKYTILVIGRATSVGEFFNTFAHEINHLCGAIEEEYGIDPHSEEASYLIGDIVMQIINDV